VTPIREFAYLPEGVISGHELTNGQQRAGKRPEDLVQAQPKSES
jgi:NAD(P)H-quinone oxidoreductase subunit I